MLNTTRKTKEKPISERKTKDITSSTVALPDHCTEDILEDLVKCCIWQVTPFGFLMVDPKR
jgi:hypothetical protein